MMYSLPTTSTLVIRACQKPLRDFSGVLKIERYSYLFAVLQAESLPLIQHGAERSPRWDRG